MRNFIKEWLASRKRKNEQQRIRYLREEFSVKERCGVIYLTHLGVAFEQIGRDIPASEIAQRLNEARTAAQTYRTN